MVLARKRKHSREFKLEAIRLLENDPRPGAQLARDLGVTRAMLYRWQQELHMGKKKPHTKKPAKPGAGTSAAAVVDEGDELERLRQRIQQLERENELLQQEKDILKKATAFFAKESR